MATASEKAAYLRQLGSQGKYAEAYAYMAQEIRSNPSWNPKVADWMDSAREINGNPDSFLRKFVFASNAYTLNMDPAAPTTEAVNQLISDNLAKSVIANYALSLEQNSKITTADLYRFEIFAATQQLHIDPEDWAGGPLGWFLYDFPVSDFLNSPAEYLAWFDNALDAFFIAALQAPEDFRLIIYSNFLLPAFNVISDLDIGGLASTRYLLESINDLLDRLLSDPLVLDLDGDGVELASLVNGVTKFDIDGDGALERTGWAAPDDGFLVHDENINGAVDGVGELFGNSRIDGFAELAQFDSNKDGKINANDANFTQLSIWRDLNSDGRSQQDELQTLAQAGITYINLNYTAISAQNAGNLIKGVANYGHADGSVRQIASVDFALTEIKAALPADADLSQLAALPNLAGQGGLHDLHVAMFFDPALKQMVEDLIASEGQFETFAEFRDGGFLDVLYRWAGLPQSADVGSGEGPLWLQALSSFTGRPLQELSAQQVERVEVAWESFVKQLGVSFLVQAFQLDALRPVLEFASGLKNLDPLSPGFQLDFEALISGVPAHQSELAADGYIKRFEGLRFDSSTGALIGDLQQIVKEFLSEQPSFGAELAGGSWGSARPSMWIGENSGSVRHPWTAWYEDQGSLLFSIAQQMGLSDEYVLNVTGWRWLAGQATDHDGTSGNDLLQFTVTTYEVRTFSSEGVLWTPIQTRDQRLFGYGGDDTLRGNDGVDRLIGGTGNDILEGGSGSDMYVYSKGDGADRIVDASGTADALFFSSDLKSSALTVTRVGKTGDLLLQFGSPGDSIVLAGQWGSPSAAIESFNFVGEATLTAADIASRYLQSLATDANDQITGAWTDDVIDAGGGDDRLAGMEGNDVLYGGSGNDFLDGHTGRDQLYGGSGNDELFGSDNEDILVGGAGDDTLIGWHGDDVYQFNRGDGQDIISDRHSGFDRIEFGPGILLSDIIVSQPDGADLIISVKGTDDQIRISRTLVDGAYRIEEVRFSDGTILNHAELLQLAFKANDGSSSLWGSYNAEVIDAGGGNDEVMASDGNDYIIGGTGNDTLIGWHGDDTYRFNRGDGQDVVADNHSGNDTLEFGPGIAPAEILVLQSANGRDLILSIGGTDDRVRLSDTIPNGNNRIENIRFADGTVWSHAQLLQRAYLNNDGANSFFGSYDTETISGGAGDDYIDASDGNDILIGGTGNDTLRGWHGDDTYRFNRGDGQDVITDGYYGNDTVEFGLGIAPSDIVVTQSANGRDLILSIAGTDDQVLLSDTIRNAGNRIENIRFADGTLWNHAQLLQRAYLNNAGADAFIGSYDADTITGGAGDDYIDASDGNDILIGGTGNDTLTGWHGDDTYRFNRGDGQDVINDGYYGNDALEFGSGIAPADIIVTQSNDGGDLILSIVGTHDQVTLSRTLTEGTKRIEAVRFADGTVWSHAQLLQQVYLRNAEGDLLFGSYDAETISGGAGNDEINAGDGSDILTGGTGSDTLTGWQGDDTYRFARGDGQDVIIDGHSGNDTLEFGAGIAPSDIVVMQSADGRDLILKIAGGEDQVRLVDTVPGGANRIEWVRFSDGTSWSHAQLIQLYQAPPINPTPILGDSSSNSLVGSSASDTFYGREGHDTLTGGTGNDTLYGGHGDDTYVFNLGDGQDIVRDYDGGHWGGNDRILFGAGIAPGDVTVTQTGSGRDFLLSITGTNDSVLIDESIADAGGYRVEMVQFADGTIWNHADLVSKSLLATAGRDRLYGSGGNELLEGNAGSDILDAREGNDTLLGGTGDDTLYGREQNDILTGGAGNDILYGGHGDDTYVFNLGDGQDIVRDYDGGHWGGNDRILFGAGIAPEDVTVTQTGSGRDFLLSIRGTNDSVLIDESIADAGGHRIESIQFADGTVWSHVDLVSRSMIPTAAADRFAGSGGDELLDGGAGDDLLDAREGNDILLGGAGNDILYGREQNDLLTGGTGNDILYGGHGDDTYVFNLGDGQDIVRDYDGGHWGGNDRVLFGSGINPSDVIVTQADNGRDFLLSIRGTNDRILIDESLADGGGHRIESVQFADGQVWSHADLVNKSMVPTAGSDRFYGSGGNELLDGGAGDDLLDAREGNDTLLGGAGNDTLYGREQNDVLTGGIGNDTLYGGHGDDTYVFNLGDGQDIVRDYDGGHWGGNDRVLFGSGINSSDVIVTQADNGRDFLLTIRGTNDSVLIDESIADGGGYRVESVQFADGTVWSHADLVNRSLVATAGADRLFGSGGSELLNGGAGNDILDGRELEDTLLGGAGNDTLYGRVGHDVLNGGTGNDVLYGGAHDDTYIFNLGDGQDIVRDYDGGSWGGNDRILFGAGISPADVIVTQADNGRDFLLRIRGTEDRIVIDETVVDGGGYRVEGVQFADGTYWNHSDLFRMSLTGTAGSDVLIGDGSRNDMFGGTGDDTLGAREGDDSLQGGSGDDSLFGEGGNDIITGGIGNDRLEGGSGEDVYRFARGDGQDTIYDDGGTDRIELAVGINPQDVIVAASGQNDLVLKVRDTTDQILLYNVVTDSRNRIEEVRFADGTVWTSGDLLTRAATTNSYTRYQSAPGATSLVGTSGDDTFLATSAPITIWGAGGSDTVSYVNSTAGVNVSLLTSDTSFDASYYLAQNPDVAAAGVDPLNHYNQHGRYEGRDPNPTFDTSFYLAANPDVARSGLNPFGHYLTYGIFEGRIPNQSMAPNTQASDGFAAGDQFYAISNLIGSSYNDRLAGNNSNNILRGGTGDDILSGGAGNDLLDGGAGNDTLIGGLGGDVLSGGAGNNTFNGSAAELAGDTITDFKAGDRIFVAGASLAGLNLSQSGDVIYFSGASLTLVGLSGNTLASQAVAGGVELWFS